MTNFIGMEKKKRKTTEQEAWLRLQSLLQEAKVKHIHLPRKKKAPTLIQVVVTSAETVDQFEQLWESLEPGLTLKIDVPYVKQIKKEFQRRAASFEHDRQVMELEVDEMEPEDLEKMDIHVGGPNSVEFGSSWFPKEHWYDWMPQYDDNKASIQITIPQHTVFSRAQELLALCK